MKPIKLLIGILIMLFLVSCKSMNKISVNETNIPADIGNKNYKILFVEPDLSNTGSDNVSRVHNNSAEKYFKKNLKVLVNLSARCL